MAELTSSASPTVKPGLRIISSLSAIARPLTERIREIGSYSVERSSRTTDCYELRLQPGILPSDVQNLLDSLRPFQPPIIPDADIPGEVVAELHLGDRHRFRHWDLQIHSDSPTLTDALCNGLKNLQFDTKNLTDHYGPQDSSQIEYGGASALVRHALQWLAEPLGVTFTENKPWEERDNDVYIYIKDPSIQPLMQRFRVLIQTDNLEATQELAQQLREDGFNDIAIDLLTPEAALEARLLLETGPFATTPFAKRLKARAQQFIAQRGVDPLRYPLDVKKHGTSSARQAQLTLPLAACIDRRRPAYDGPDLERFEIAIRTDQADHPVVQELVAALRTLGFKAVDISSPGLESDDEDRPALDDDDLDLADLLQDDEATDQLIGFRIILNAAQSHPEVADQIRPLLHRAMTTLDAVPRYPLREEDGDNDRDLVKIKIDFPIEGIESGDRPEPLWYRLRVDTPNPERLAPLMEEFHTWGFLGCRIIQEDPSDSREPTMTYGGAPQELIDRIRACVRDQTGVDPEPTKEWGSHDRDIWVHLPDRAQQPTTDRKAVAVAMDHWFPEQPPFRDLIEMTANTVRVGEITLERRPGPHHALAPSWEAFVHYCLDGNTAETLLHIAASVALGEPCLLEGETSTSKTSAILYLAALLNQPVIRINLNGQTDTGELVGRYVPRALENDLPIPTEELRELDELLEPETRLILNRAAEEQRILTRAEVQQVMANERMRSHPWRWQDGPVIEAIRQGWWVILDELNLAEPQILERLNSLLEREPTLVLTEHDYRVYGNGGEPIHAGFRIFATMNPAEYAGRSTLSPAYRNRWQAFRQAAKPSEQEYGQMMRFLASGAQPATSLFGQGYRGGQGHPSHPALNTPEWATQLASLVRFHVALERASGQGDGPTRLGARRRERYIFTRRDLLSVLDYLARAPAVGQTDPELALRTAIHRYYLSRVTAGEDQQTVWQLLEANGFTPAGQSERRVSRPRPRIR